MNNKNNFWEQRYQEEDYAYGDRPNEFFQAQLEKLPKGKLLLPAEGEGRNAIWAAKQGWEVTAFDQAAAGREKALDLARKEGVNINYLISEAQEFSSTEHFDVIGLVYAHFGASERAAIHRQLQDLLKPGGKIISEAFSKDQLGNTSGGPKDKAMLFSENEVRTEFSGLRFDSIGQEEIELKEGKYHQGKGNVIRFIATKV